MNLVEVKGLKKSFGSLDVLKGVDLSVVQGERVAIIGGTAYNPFEQEEDGLQVTILKNISKLLEYSYKDGRNQINILMKV